MLARERLDIILEMLHQNKTIKISDITDRFGVSNLTARRDLDILQDQGIVKRVYGGALLVSSRSGSGPDSILNEKPTGKTSGKDIQLIGRTAAETVDDGDTIFLGAGSTVLAMAKYLRGRSNLTILTNSLAVINELASTNNTIIVLGGSLDCNEHSITGSFTNDMLRNFCAAKAFIGCGGVSVSHGVTDYSAPTAQACSLMIANSAHTYLLCSSKKFSGNALAITCPITSIDTIITDDNLDSKLRNDMTRLGIELKLVASK